MSESIYHLNSDVIRLNLKAIRELLDRKVPHFDSLTTRDKQMLQRRFTEYCRHGAPDFSPGSPPTKFSPENPPSIDNLPNKAAIRSVLQKFKTKEVKA